jgi:hypothetical protein
MRTVRGAFRNREVTSCSKSRSSPRESGATDKKSSNEIEVRHMRQG